MEILCDSVEETKRFAFDFATKVEKETVISLNGNLGAGKTTFTKIILFYLHDKIWYQSKFGLNEK